MKAVALFAAFAVAWGGALAAGPLKPPPALDAVRQALARAAAAHDRKGVAALIAFPLTLDNYGSPPTLSEAAFLKNGDYFAILFGGGDPDVLKCIATAPPARQLDGKELGAGAWVADCNGNEFIFAQRNGAWRLTAYQNFNE